MTLDLSAFLLTPAFRAALRDAGGTTLCALRNLVLDEEDRRSVSVMHENLREALGWLYGEPDAAGVRIASIEVPAASWDDGWWWDPRGAVVVFSDGSRVTEDLEELLHEPLTELAGNMPPEGPRDVYTLIVPLPGPAVGGSEAGGGA
ncbi:hypothetical protein ABT093_19800 [Kitasatospora sp. NPDC002551]|uniref:hypothetical protein n=1 Tax=Kitasatospora sp. NPDC002551 TaxID=3154539 RepID=UPI003320697D